MRNTIVALFLCVTSFTLVARENTLQGANLISNIEQVAIENTAIETNDSINPIFNRNAISIKGFDKRVSESRETFFVVNNTIASISRIKIQLRYTDINGNMLHQREELIDCDIPASETRQLSISTFDRQRGFYYYLSPKPRKQATPFKVAFQLLRYDIKIEP